MKLPEPVAADLRRRLHRAAGQVAAIERMLDEGRDCRELVTQVSAATKALEQVGFRIIATGLTYCVTEPDAAAGEGYSVDLVEKMLLRLG